MSASNPTHVLQPAVEAGAPVRSTSGRRAPALPRPGLVHGAYPQRPTASASLWRDLADAAGDALTATLLHPLPMGSRCGTHSDCDFDAARRELATDPRTLDLQLHALRCDFSAHGWREALVARALLLVAEAVETVWGQRPYPTQLRAARAMLGGVHLNQLVEMDTGEGKTLAILMAAATAALSGVPVHVVTANDYLAARDAEHAAPVLERLGLRGAAITPRMDRAARGIAYANDVVYVTARELGFDYLRDHLGSPLSLQTHRGQRPAHAVLRGLCMALIDEADSVLLDHARTPLVMAVRDTAREAEEVEHALRKAVYAFSATLKPGADYRLDAQHRSAELSGGAQQRLEAALADLPSRPDDARISAELLRQSLVVRHVLKRDRHYLVKREAGQTADTIVLIDDTTGRTLPGTVWSRGLSTLVALKEGLATPEATRTVNQITLQRLFARYWKVGGVSGTLRESRAELYATYRLRVRRIEPRVPSRRRHLGTVVALNTANQHRVVAERVRRVLATGQPVLVGTGSVDECDALAAALHAAGLAPRVLNAREDADEPALVAQAGQPGALTVTTNMAGRGTDIPLSPEALAAGGLHVIACTLNESPRVDRQFFGRTARNGQPGTTEAILSMEAGIFARTFPHRLPRVLHILGRHDGLLPRRGGQLLARVLQALVSGQDAWRRWRMAEHDRQAQAMLAFTRGIG